MNLDRLMGGAHTTSISGDYLCLRSVPFPSVLGAEAVIIR